MIERLPVGSLVGMLAIALVIGVVLGRSGRFMSKLGSMHAAAHSGDSAAKASAAGGNAEQRVQTVVVVDPRATDRGSIEIDRAWLETGSAFEHEAVRAADPVVELPEWEAAGLIETRSVDLDADDLSRESFPRAVRR